MRTDDGLTQKEIVLFLCLRSEPNAVRMRASTDGCVFCLHLQLCVFLCFHFVHGHNIEELKGGGIVRGLETRTL